MIKGDTHRIGYGGVHGYFTQEFNHMRGILYATGPGEFFSYDLLIMIKLTYPQTSRKAIEQDQCNRLIITMFFVIY